MTHKFFVTAPGIAQEMDVEEFDTLADVLDYLVQDKGVRDGSYAVSVNGSISSLDNRVQSESFVSFAKKETGGC